MLRDVLNSPGCAIACHKSKKARSSGSGPFLRECLTMSYFHTGIRTIIGAESFHGPVRDGKVWFQLAMVIRQKGLPRWV